MDWADRLAKIVETKQGLDTPCAKTAVSAHPEDYGQVASVLGLASSLGLTVYPVGSATNPVGPPVRADIALVMSRLNSILEVSAENLYVAAQAGCPLGQLAAQLERAGLFLPADYSGSLGGWAATNAVSLFSTWYGLPRELVLGAKLCTGDGVIVSSGSKTTKFSSGYKVWKSLVGSLGWLGVYLELYVRVYPRPEAFVSGRGDASLLPLLIRGPTRPVSVWALFEEGGRELVWAVFAGYASALRKIDLPMSFSEGVVKPPAPEGNVVLVAAKRGLEDEYARRALRLLGGRLALAYMGTGVVRVSVDDFSKLEDARKAMDTPIVVERGNYAGDYWGYRPSTIRRLKEALDPKGVLSPGKF